MLDQAGYIVHEAGDGITALHLVADADVVLLDLQLPRRSGMEVLQQLATEHPGLPVIIFSGKGSIRSAVEATRLGIYDFLEKAVDPQRILLTVRNALEKVHLQRLRDTRYAMVGESSAMQEVFAFLDHVAALPSKVLLLGESGTGKELVAHALHHHSPRHSLNNKPQPQASAPPQPQSQTQPQPQASAPPDCNPH